MIEEGGGGQKEQSKQTQVSQDEIVTLGEKQNRNYRRYLERKRSPHCEKSEYEKLVNSRLGPVVVYNLLSLTKTDSSKKAARF